MTTPNNNSHRPRNLTASIALNLSNDDPQSAIRGLLTVALPLAVQSAQEDHASQARGPGIDTTHTRSVMDDNGNTVGTVRVTIFQ